MSQRQQKGGTLALIAASAIIIIIVGIGMFFLMQMLGGGREAQQATDAGNLNVAKRALLTPNVQPTPAESLTFQDLFDKDLGGNNVVNLQNYNKFVGKAFLVAMNAQAEGTAAAKTNAQTEIDLVEGKPTSIGARLWQKLHDPAQTGTLFGLAGLNNIRMLNWQGSGVASDGTLDKVAFMRKANGAPSNVGYDDAQVPAGLAGPVVGDTSGTYIKKRKDASGRTRNFLVGYQDLPIGTLHVVAVPVRPGEQPHLVSQEQFETQLNPPPNMGSVTAALIPPNAFESNSSSSEMLTKGNVRLRSSAIVGTLNQEFTASIPDGFVVIDNKTNNLSASVPGFVNDIFADALMGSGVTVGGADNVLTKNAGDFGTAASAPVDGSGNLVNPSALRSSTSFKPPQSDAQLNNIARNSRNGTENSFPCSGSVPAGQPGSAFSEPCASKLAEIQANYPPDGTGTTGTGPFNDLMAIEYLKAKVLEIRAGYDSVGCGDAYADGSCTGLKKYQHTTQMNVPFGTTGTLSELLNQTNGNIVMDQIKQRMHQINPEASDYDSIFATPINMNTVGFLFYDKTSNAFKIAASLPFAAPDLTAEPNLPDGTAEEHSSPFGDLNGRIINVPGEQGYPNPWDCPPSSSNQGPSFGNLNVIGAASDKSIWTPSSGFKNLLGILKLRNCAKGGGHWCCPC